MKKRLLSALLALVMVLAMLPATAFADDPADQTEDAALEEDAGGPVLYSAPTVSGTAYDGGQATYATALNSAWGDDFAVTDLPNWVVRSKNQVDDGNGKKVYTYAIAESGFVQGTGNSGTYYSTLTALPTSKDGEVPNNVTAINESSLDIPDNITSMTLELTGNSSSATISGGAKLTSLTLKSSRPVGGAQVAITSIARIPANLTLENVDASSVSISEGSVAFNTNRTIKLTNSKIGAITMVGNGTMTVNEKSVTVNNSRSVNATNSTIGAISVQGGTASKVELTNCTQTGTISVTCNGGSVSVNGGTVGDITVKTMLTEAKAQNLPSVSVSGYATVTSIKGDSGEKSTSAATVTIAGSSTVAAASGNSIEFKNANVTVSGGTVGNVDLDGGKLDITGSYVKVGEVDLSGTVTLKVAGSSAGTGYNTVGKITLPGTTNKTITINVPDDPTNTLGSTDSSLGDYSGHGINGGTWKFDVPKAALATNLAYYLIDFHSSSTPGDWDYTYYTAAQLGTALNKQKSTSGALRVTGQTYAGTPGEIRFMNGATSWGTMQVSKATEIQLPDMVNNVKLSNWTDGNATYTLPSKYTSPALDKMAVDENSVPYVELNASGGVNTGDATKLTKVTAVANNEAGRIRAELVGTVITLSGAMPDDDSDVKLTLTTDAVEKKDGKEVPVELTIDVHYNGTSKGLTFANPGTTKLDKGMTLETDSNGLSILRLSNGTKYTLSGTGLKVRSSIKVAGYDADDYGDVNPNYSFIEVTVSDPTLKNDADKQKVIDMLAKGTDGAKFDWTNSPAMYQAINAALATITESDVENMLKETQRQAWTKLHTGTSYNAAAHSTLSGYDYVWLVPYLQINVTQYRANGSLTATLVPSWRAEVRQAANTTNGYQNAFYDAKKPVTYQNAPGVRVVRTGSLGALTGNMGNADGAGVVVTFKLGSEFNSTYMHQDSTYAYAAAVSGDNQSFTITHAGSGSNGLGSVVINTTGPLVSRWATKDKGANDFIAWYDTLQAAVDDTTDQQYIEVDQTYKGSMNITVTGSARTIYIQSNGNNVLVSNTNNGLVTLNETGGLYTIQLTRDATAVGGTTAEISVAAGVTNGTVTLSTTRARANSTVEVTTTPAAGYLTRNLTATARTADNRNTTVAVTKTGDNKYTFKVPAGATSITVTPTFALNTGLPFTDVAADNSYFEAVKYVYNRGMMNGVPAANGTTIFDGYSTITRGQVVTILYRLSGSPSASTYSGFNDVPSNQYYAAPITWAYSNGIVGGYGNGQFGPNDPITREQLAKILRDYSAYRGLNVTNSTSLAGYNDAGSVHDWAQAGMQWAVGNGIVTGTTTTTLTPGGNAQRYHAATMLMRYCNSFGL